MDSGRAVRGGPASAPAAVPRRPAGTLESYAWALFNAGRSTPAIQAAEDAVRRREEERVDDGALGQALVAAAVMQWINLRPAAARNSIDRAVQLLDSDGDTARRALALIYRGVLLIPMDREQEALVSLDAGIGIAERLGAADLVALGQLSRGHARLVLADPDGLTDLLGSIALARALPHHEHVLMGYANLVEALWRLGRFAELDGHLEEGTAFARDRDFSTFALFLEAYRNRLLIVRGGWEAGGGGLRALLGQPVDQHLVRMYAGPAPARLAVRQGAADAHDVVAQARENAVRTDSLRWLLPAAVIDLEEAWLTGRSEPARSAAITLLERTEPRGRERDRGELLRWLGRLGHPVEPFPDCPDEFAAGCGVTGGPRLRPGSASAIRTSGRWSSRSRVRSHRCWRRSRCSTAWVRGPPRRGRAGGCASSGCRRCPGARRRPPGAIPRG